VLTEKGQSLLDELHTDEEPEFVGCLLRGFSPSEVSLLNEWLQRLSANMGDDSRNLF
jgi:DNA-binding MarR family transcriptional regulator